MLNILYTTSYTSFIHLKCKIRFISTMMCLLRKWKRCESWSASSQTQGELDLHCFQDKV